MQRIHSLTPPIINLAKAVFKVSGLSVSAGVTLVIHAHNAAKLGGGDIIASQVSGFVGLTALFPLVAAAGLSLSLQNLPSAKWPKFIWALFLFWLALGVGVFTSLFLAPILIPIAGPVLLTQFMGLITPKLALLILALGLWAALLCLVGRKSAFLFTTFLLGLTSMHFVLSTFFP